MSTRQTRYARPASLRLAADSSLCRQTAVGCISDDPLKRMDGCAQVAMLRVSAAAIDSLSRAIQTWKKDREKAEKAGAEPAGQPASELPAEFLVEPHERFMPYTVRNLLAEPLLVILEDGAESQVAPGGALELTYQQVWRRRGIAALRLDEQEHGISNHVGLPPSLILIAALARFRIRDSPAQIGTRPVC
jgi:hypothetical protein